MCFTKIVRRQTMSPCKRGGQEGRSYALDTLSPDSDTCCVAPAAPRAPAQYGWAPPAQGILPPCSCSGLPGAYQAENCSQQFQEPACTPWRAQSASSVRRGRVAPSTLDRWHTLSRSTYTRGCQQTSRKAVQQTLQRKRCRSHVRCERASPSSPLGRRSQSRGFGRWLPAATKPLRPGSQCPLHHGNSRVRSF